MPSMSRPSSTTMLPEGICSFSTLAGTLVLIQAGNVVGLKPSSSTLYPPKTAANPSLAMPDEAGALPGAAACGC